MSIVLVDHLLAGASPVSDVRDTVAGFDLVGESRVPKLVGRDGIDVRTLAKGDERAALVLLADRRSVSSGDDEISICPRLRSPTGLAMLPSG